MGIHIKSRQRFDFLVAFLILAVASGILYSFSQIKVRSFIIEHTDKRSPIKPNLFLTFFNYPKGLLRATFTVEVPRWAPHEIGLRVDDCIEKVFVNGRLLRLKEDLSLHQPFCRRNFVQNINFKNYLKKGINVIAFEVVNHGGDGGIYITPPASSVPTRVLMFFWGLLIATLITYLWQKYYRDRKELFALWISAFGAFMYLVMTPWDQRGHDLNGHLLYIEFLIKNLRMPLPDDCWECFQAPGYYVVTGLITKIATFLMQSTFMTLFSLQIFSLFLMFLFLFQLRKLWSHAVGDSFSFVLTLFVVSTPSFFIHSARIGNDLLFYCTSLLCIATMMSYWKTVSKRDLVLLNVFLAVSFLVKATSLGLLMSYALLLGFTFLRERKKSDFSLESDHAKETLLIVFFGSFLIIGSYYIRNLAYSLPLKAFELNRLSSALGIPHGIKYFLMVDFPTFFKDPHAEAFAPGSGREYFWNGFIKGINVSEFRVTGSFKEFVLNLRNGIVLVLMLLSVYSWFHPKNRKALYANLPIILTAFCFVVSMMAYQWIYPFSVMSNARIVFPFLIGFASLAWLKGFYVRELLYLSIALGVVFWFEFFITSQF